MHENKVLLAGEKANCMKQVRAAIGRQLKEEYACGQPMPERLSDLLMKIEDSSSKGALSE
jgi:hypothetical protein